MKRRIFFALVLSAAHFFVGCRPDNDATGNIDEAPKEVVHYNFILIPDLSNRLTHGTGLSDADVVRAIIGNVSKIAHLRRFTDQKDRYSVLLTSQQLGPLYGTDFSKLCIDLGRFSSQKDRIDYLNGIGTGNTLKKDTSIFLTEFLSLEAKALSHPEGADLWSMFHSGIGSNQIIGQTDGPPRGKFIHSFRNILVLLTDGYIEAGTYKPAGCEGYQCRYLSKNRIDEFRRAFLRREDHTADLRKFFQSNGYGIIAADNPRLKEFEVLLLQVEDRSLTTAGNATVYPADFEIMSLFWRDWMEKSGVRHFEIRPVARDKHDCEQNIFSFLRDRKGQ